MPRIGTFQILGTLGTGAHSTILHVRLADSKQYALKLVPIENKEDWKFLDQAQHEFRVAQLLDHPNLVKIHTLETVRDWFFRVKKAHLLIEYVNGQTLDTIARLSLPRLVQIFAKIASGMMHMHRRGVCHADLKPNNILLSRAGQVKIIDYGLAWIKNEPKHRVQGTPEYMAPEQAQNSIVNEQTDIYNFGATMYRLVTFRLPPSTLTTQGAKVVDAKTFQKQLRPVRDLSPNCPALLCDLIHQCLAFLPQHRPERMGKIQEVLKFLEEKMVLSPKDSLETLEW